MRAAHMCGFLAAGLILAPMASALQVSDTQPFNVAVPTSNQLVPVAQFDDMGGTRVLNSISLEINSTIGANTTGENDSLSGGSITMNLSGNATADLYTLNTATIVNASAGPVAVSATDGVSGSGPDFYNFGNVSGNDTDSDTILSGFGSFIGLGTIDVSVDANGGFNISGVSNSTLQVSNFNASGTVKVIYDYTQVPEPTALSLLSLGGLGLLRRRRR
ncbi:MAG: choice-of-anchor E domain-containing protein [Phycisphaerales bacterium]|nr:choice-of-anchor E domain-containing protein [Phycisphaerales bacterium]